MKIFVGNISFDAVEADVQKAFEVFGTVALVDIVKEKNGVRSRGFGFVDMPDQQQAENAIAGLEGKDFMGRPLNVSPARPKSEEERQEAFKHKAREKIAVKVQIRQRNDLIKKAQWAKDGLAKTGGYKGGRRTRSFIRKLTEEPAAQQALRKRPWEKAVKPPRPWRKPGAIQAKTGPASYSGEYSRPAHKDLKKRRPQADSRAKQGRPKP